MVLLSALNRRVWSYLYNYDIVLTLMILICGTKISHIVKLHLKRVEVFDRKGHILYNIESTVILFYKFDGV